MAYNDEQEEGKHRGVDKVPVCGRRVVHPKTMALALPRDFW